MNEGDTFNKLKKWSFDEVQGMIVSKDPQTEEEYYAILNRAGWSVEEFLDEESREYNLAINQLLMLRIELDND